MDPCKCKLTLMYTSPISMNPASHPNITFLIENTPNCTYQCTSYAHTHAHQHSCHIFFDKFVSFSIHHFF